jgi:hypothetical protein
MKKPMKRTVSFLFWDTEPWLVVLYKPRNPNIPCECQVLAMRDHRPTCVECGEVYPHAQVDYIAPLYDMLKGLVLTIKKYKLVELKRTIIDAIY